MTSVRYLLIASFLVGLVSVCGLVAQKKDNTAYFAGYHDQVGRKNSLRRIGPGEKYSAFLGGPELGRAVIVPNEDIVAGSFGTWEIIYTAGEAGLDTTDALNIYFPYGFNPPLLHYPSFPKGLVHNYNEERSRSFSPGLTAVSATRPGTELILYTSIRDYSRQSEGTNLYIGISGERLRPGDRIILLYGDTTYGGPGASAAYFAQDHEFTTFVLENVDWDKFEQMTGDLGKQQIRLHTAAEKMYCLENPPALRVVGGDAARFAFTVPSVAEVNQPFDLHVLPVDRHGNESKTYQGLLSFASSAAVELPGTCRVEGSDELFVRIPGGGKISRSGVYRLVVRDEQKGLTGESNPIKVVAGPGVKKILWGDLHVHSFESDGIGSPDYDNRFCRDIAALDYCCICDHANGVFKEIRESAIKFTEPGKFVSFSGFEGLAGDMPGGGHVNFYFVDDRKEYEQVIEPAVQGKPVYESRKEIWGKLLAYGEKKVIAVPHNHNRGGWDEMDSPLVRLNEIHSVWGNSEYTATPEKAYKFGHTTYRTFQQALAAGLKLGCIAAGDEHSGRGGTGTWLRHFKSNSAGISAAYSSELTKQAIFDALWDRQVYGTTGARIIVDFSVNGSPMGSEIKVSSPAAKREIKLEVEGTDNIHYVAVIRNNEEWYRKEGSGKDFRLELADDSPLAGTSFYYLRVVQQDEHMAWSSPVWVSVE